MNDPSSPRSRTSIQGMRPRGEDGNAFGTATGIPVRMATSGTRLGSGAATTTARGGAQYGSSSPPRPHLTPASTSNSSSSSSSSRPYPNLSRKSDSTMGARYRSAPPPHSQSQIPFPSYPLFVNSPTGARNQTPPPGSASKPTHRRNFSNKQHARAPSMNSMTPSGLAWRQPHAHDWWRYLRTPSRRAIRRWVRERYRAFGRHCARNQIRVLLIDSFVMTTLFYPALALHFQRNQPTFLRNLMSPLTAGSTTTATATQTQTQRTMMQNLHASSGASTGPRSWVTQTLDVFFPYPERLVPPPDSRHFWEDEPAYWFANEVSLNVKGKGKGKDPNWAGNYWAEGVEERVDLVEILFGWTDVGSVFANGQPNTSYRRQNRSERDEQILHRLDQLLQDWLTRDDGLDCIREEEAVSTSQSEGTRCLFHPLESKRIAGTKTEGADLFTQYAVYLKPSSKRNKRWLTSMREHLDGLVGQLMSEEGAEILQPKSTDRHGSGFYEIRLAPQVAGNPNEYGEGDSSTRNPTEIAKSRSVPKTILLLYAVILAYLLFLMLRDKETHSRWGLALTGIVELAASSVMSFSVMALLGIGGSGFWSNNHEYSHQPGVPWYILPFVVLVVGVENMSTLTRAVYAIPISRSVPDRIGYGMANVGPRLFLTSISDISILTLIRMVVKLRPVQEFCTFASVLIFVDWWMLQTFYLTVLSIDCQRLELADLIRSKKMPTSPNKKTNKQSAAIQLPHDLDSTTPIKVAASVGSSSLKWGLQRLWKARTTRGLSLVLLLTSLTALYYFNESQQGHALDQLFRLGGGPPPTQPLTVQSPSQTADLINALSAAGSFGITLLKAVRPSFSSLTVASFGPISLVFPHDGFKVTPEALLSFDQSISRPYLPRLRPLVHLIKVVFLPQFATAFVLWLVLLYLLKDAQLLDARRDRGGFGEGMIGPGRDGISRNHSGELKGPATDKLEIKIYQPTGIIDVQAVAVLATINGFDLVVRHIDGRTILLRGNSVLFATVAKLFTLSRTADRLATIDTENVLRIFYLPLGSSPVLRSEQLIDRIDESEPTEMLFFQDHLYIAFSGGSIGRLIADGSFEFYSSPGKRKTRFVTSSDHLYALQEGGGGNFEIIGLNHDLQWQERLSVCTEDGEDVISVSAGSYRNQPVFIVLSRCGSLQLFNQHDPQPIWSHSETWQRLLDPLNPPHCFVSSRQTTTKCSRCEKLRAPTITIIWSNSRTVDVVKLSEESDDQCKCQPNRLYRNSISNGDFSHPMSRRLSNRSAGDTPNHLRSLEVTSPLRSHRMSADSSPAKAANVPTLGTNSSTDSSAPKTPKFREYWSTPFDYCHGDWVVVEDDTLVIVHKGGASGRNESGWQVRFVDLTTTAFDSTSLPIIKADLDRANDVSLQQSLPLIAFSRIKLFGCADSRMVGLSLGNRSAVLTVPALTPHSDPFSSVRTSCVTTDPGFLSPSMMTPIKSS